MREKWTATGERVALGAVGEHRSGSGTPAPLVVPFGGVWPRVAGDAFVAPGAVVTGDVEVGEGASVWFNAVVRGDVAPVRIGARSNVQDGAILHVDSDAPCTLGEDVTVGHRAVVHGATVGDGATIGMGAVVLSRATVGAGAVVAAGAVVPEGAEVRPGTLVAGVPAVEKRELGADRQAAAVARAARYVELAGDYRAALAGGSGDGG